MTQVTGIGAAVLVLCTPLVLLFLPRSRGPAAAAAAPRRELDAEPGRDRYAQQL
jgi:hypothetical protein